ncbi:MAG TPA: LysR family transcriptional regulator [Lachnospiraceae bacterium]|nr:LysR family transcriptional regulator [Lachnospiraceae bacterium]
MTIRHIQIFLAVVECGNMHRAAESLFMSQPGVSQAIRELEKSYQVRLFERYKRQLILTPEGERLYRHSRILLQQYDTLNKDMATSHKKPVLRIGATVSVGEELLVPFVTDFEKQYPNIRLEVTVNNTEYIENKIRKGELDAGLIEGQTAGTELLLFPFYNDCMQVVAAPDNPLAGKKAIEAKQLAEWDIITREHGSHIRNVLTRLLQEKGIYPRIKWSCTNVHTIKLAVMAGQGISLLSSLVVNKEVKEGKLCVLDVKDLDGRRTIKLATHKDKHMNDAIKKFLEYAERYQENADRKNH